MKYQLPNWCGLSIAVAAGLCVLGFYSNSGAAPQGNPPPFANSVEQRGETIRELREIKELLKEQNSLLRGNAKAAAKTDDNAKPQR